MAMRHTARKRQRQDWNTGLSHTHNHTHAISPALHDFQAGRGVACAGHPDLMERQAPSGDSAASQSMNPLVPSWVSLLS